MLFVTPEYAPLVKVGGLGDVSASLPAALRRLGIDVRVLLPGFPAVAAQLARVPPLAALTLLGQRARLMEVTLARGVPLMALDCPPLYQRSGGPYQDETGADWKDNAMRFGVLSKAAAMLASATSPLPWRPHVVHLNDWPSALTAAYLHYLDGEHAYSVITVHNLAFQGNFEPDTLEALQLPAKSYAPDGLEFHGSVSFLKAGLYYGDAITTVSPTYAREIQTGPFGAGMHGLLQQRSQSLVGILNGIDIEEWNPASDPHLPVHYTDQTLTRKKGVKRALAARLQLTAGHDDAPLIGFVGRLTQQKGVDLLLEAIPEILALRARIAVLGAGERHYERALRGLAAQHPGSVGVHIGFDETLAHLIEAGADMFLMPSRFEPCGLNQMYSQRYGTPPIAHATGGLVDTIVDCTSEKLQAGSATGFLFREPSTEALTAAVRRALALYCNTDSWCRL
ncbi:MAG TPA: glycogen synthase GlgA, partial [Burkholderiales bacterium]|nr:glycogen synthase GlgA [Burkholderiales bacterium]